MQERINKRRFASLVALIVLGLVFFWWIQPENRLDIDPDTFQVADLRAVSRVELDAGSGLVRLSYEGSNWLVNDVYRADADMIRVLFATLQQARPKRRVPTAQRDSVFRKLERSGVRVSLYIGGERAKAFLAGGNAAKTQSFFADPRSGEVYVMTIPGYRVYVAGILELPEDGWRDKFVFSFNWRNFNSLAATFPGNSAADFTVSFDPDRDFYGIEGTSQADTARLNTFLDRVSLLEVDAFISEPGVRDSLLRGDPRMELRVTDIAKREYRLRLYDSGGSGKTPGIVQDSQVVVFDRRKIELLLKPKSFFIKK